MRQVYSAVHKDRPCQPCILCKILLAVGWVPVGLAGSESVEYTAFLVVRLVGGQFSFLFVPVVRLVHFAGCSTVPTGPATEKKCLPLGLW